MRRLSLLLALLGVVALAGLAGCRTEPSVAAYVGNLRITTAELADAVDTRMADDNIASVVDPGDATYQRLVLFQLVRQAEYRLLSAQYDVSVSDRDVQVWLDDQLSQPGAPTKEDFYRNAATGQQLSAMDVTEYFRQLLLRQEIAAQAGLDGPTQTVALRQRYEQVKSQLATIEFGFIVVPDQASADATLAALLANPASYGQLAATYANPYTQPTLLSSLVSDLPAELVPSVLQTPVGQGFSLAIPSVGGIGVGYVASLTIPTFMEAETQLRNEAASGVDAAAAELVAGFVADLNIDINPRYGSLNDAGIAPDTDGALVRILEDAGTA